MLHLYAGDGKSLTGCTICGTYADKMIIRPPLKVVFYRTEAGNEPVREWLKSLPREDRKIIGEDIKTVQFGWPLGMPLVKKMEPGLWEVRSRLRNRIARVLFTRHGDWVIVLLHGFMKKTQKTPAEDLALARKRMLETTGGAL